MVKVCHNGAWYPLIGKKIYTGGTWIALKYRDWIRHAGNWYPLGSIEEAEFDRDPYGWFPVTVKVENYICDADVEYDPNTGDETYSNYRWQLMSTEYGVRSPGLDPGGEYPQWRYYTVGETGNSYDFSIQVDPATGAIVGSGDDLHNGRTMLPAPGQEWYMDSVSVISVAQAAILRS